MSSYVQIPPGGPAGRVWSGRFYKFHYTDPTRLSATPHDQTSCTDTVCTEHVEIEWRTSLRPDKVGGLVTVSLVVLCGPKTHGHSVYSACRD